MNLRVRTWKHVLIYSALAVALAIAAPVALVTAFLPPWLPLLMKVPVYTTAIMIPLLIATPLAFFGLHMFKLINGTIDALDRHVKFDHLTGLLSRGYFLSSAEFARARGGHFLMIDADHFKRINDTFGHDGGDVALKAISRIVMNTGGGDGIAGRLGGEEFALYLPGAGRAQAARMAEALLAAIRGHPLHLGGRQVALTVSIGIAEDRAGSTLAQAMKSADVALYAAKSGGRDRFVFAEDAAPALELVA